MPSPILDQYQEQDDDYWYFGTLSDTHAGQSFKPAVTGNIHSVTVRLYKFRFPEDNVTMAIYSSSGGVPGSSIVSSTTLVSGTELDTASPADFTFLFPDGNLLVAETEYWIVLGRDGDLDSTNRYRLRSSNSTVTDLYSRGELYLLENGGSWYKIAGANQWIDAVFWEYYSVSASVKDVISPGVVAFAR